MDDRKPVSVQDALNYRFYMDRLTYGTRKENAQDRVLNGTDNNARKTHCPACELPYDEANTYWYKGARQCKELPRPALQ
jgi:hypothetical protein